LVVFTIEKTKNNIALKRH